jgi:nicotinamidase-related amidase
MQRDFIEPGGFGETPRATMSACCQAIVPTVGSLIEGLPSRQGLPVIHTRECHRPDLSDCPPAKRERGKPVAADRRRGTMGRLLIAGEPGNDIVPALSAEARRDRHRQAGQGRLLRHRSATSCGEEGITHLVFAGVTTEVCVQTTMREANDRGFECLLAEDATESYFPEFKAATLDMIRAQGAIVGWDRHRRPDRRSAALTSAAPARARRSGLASVP